MKLLFFLMMFASGLASCNQPNLLVHEHTFKTQIKEGELEIKLDGEWFYENPNDMGKLPPDRYFFIGYRFWPNTEEVMTLQILSLEVTDENGPAMEIERLGPEDVIESKIWPFPEGNGSYETVYRNYLETFPRATSDHFSEQYTVDTEIEICTPAHCQRYHFHEDLTPNIQKIYLSPLALAGGGV